MLEQVAADPAFIAGFFTILGGITLKVVERWLNTSKVRIDTNRDYREQIKELSDRLDKEEQEVSVWRKKFFEAEEANHRLRMSAMDFQKWEEDKDRL